MKKDVSIVIPTWNGLPLLQRFLPSVIAAANFYSEHSSHNVEIIIVDDGSTDDTVEWLDRNQTSGARSQGKPVVSSAPEKLLEGESKVRSQDERVDGREVGSEKPGSGIQNQQSAIGIRQSKLPTIRYLRNAKNLGFSQTCNKGIAAANYPLIFLLNNDVEVEINAIAPLVRHFADDEVFAVHCRVFELETGRECGTGKVGSFARGFIRVHQSYAANDDATHPSEKNLPEDFAAACLQQDESKPLYSMFAGGGSAMFDRDKFLAIGGFEHLLSPFYWEDVEISYRAWKRGFKVLYEPHSVVKHRVSSTISKLNQRRVRLIEQRNRIIYHWIHLQDSSLLIANILWVTLLAMTALLRFAPMFFLSVVEALKRLPAIRQRRREESLQAKRTDRELFAVFEALKLRQDLQIYDGIKDSQK